jgi:P27 family predicted phage terminase small subunit
LTTAEARNGVVVRMPPRSSAAPAAASPAAPRSPRSSTANLTAPDWLTPTGKAAFRRVVRHYDADAPGWLTGVDVELLALCVEHLSLAIAASKAMRGRGGYKVLEVDEAHRDRRRKTPAHQVFREATASYVTLARELGLTPKARQELEVGLAGIGPDVDDDDDDVLDG